MDPISGLNPNYGEMKCKRKENLCAGCVKSRRIPIVCIIYFWFNLYLFLIKMHFHLMGNQYRIDTITFQT